MNETTAKGKNLTDKKGKQAIMNPEAIRDIVRINANTPWAFLALRRAFEFPFHRIRSLEA